MSSASAGIGAYRAAEAGERSAAARLRVVMTQNAPASFTPAFEALSRHRFSRSVRRDQRFDAQLLPDEADVVLGAGDG